MIILKHVRYKIRNSSDLEKMLNHLKERTSEVEVVSLKDICFPKGKDEFILVLECISEDRYLEWREICPSLSGVSDWYEIFLTKDEQFHDN